MRGPGITAIAHPASVDVATTHGVFILQDMEGVVAQYAKGEGRGRKGGMRRDGKEGGEGGEEGRNGKRRGEEEGRGRRIGGGEEGGG